jgi:hypothetical protein
MIEKYDALKRHIFRKMLVLVGKARKASCRVEHLKDGSLGKLLQPFQPSFVFVGKARSLP